MGQGDLSKRLYRALRATPPSTTIVLRAARAGVEAMQLGGRGETDLLLLSLAGLDYVGHSYGTASRERMDLLLRMHDELGAFLAGLRSRLGDRVAVLLSSDHGATPSPGTAAAVRQRALLLRNADLAAVVQKALDEALGPHQGWVLTLDDGVLGLRRFPGVDPARAAEVAARSLRGVTGVWKAVTAAEIDREPALVRHAFFPGRSGDVLFVPGPLAAITGPDDAATHGSPWTDDALVPLLARAPGFALRRGGVLEATQVAPSLALLLGIAPPAGAFADPALDAVK